MMKLQSYFPYAEFVDFKALELPYKGENVSMMILLPKERDGLKSMERNLTLEKLSTLKSYLREAKVDVTIPKFKIEYSKEMSEDFKSIGARSVFTSADDFTGIASDQDLALSGVIHKAVIEVNEEGSEAAAVTGLIGVRRRARGPRFTANHPFLFAIVDQRNGMVLFLGHVTCL